MICPTLEQGGSFLSGTLYFLDCQAQQIGAQGYQILAAPGSTASMVLTGLLTLFIALIGYRLLLGQRLRISDAVLMMVKLGIVLTFATSWPAYRTLIYDVALRSPAELTAAIGGASTLPGAQGGLVPRLEIADRALATLAIVGTGGAPTARGIGATTVSDQTPPPFVGFNAFALGSSRIIFLFGVIGAFAIVRIITGLLLATAPLFFAFLLFDGSRGLFEGWVRVLVAATLGAFGTAMILGIELAFLEPWLNELLTIRAAQGSIPSAPTELLVVTSVFCLVLAATLYAMGRLAAAFRLPRFQPATASHHMGDFREKTILQQLGGSTRTPPQELQSRVLAIAGAVAASQRRDNAIEAAAAASVQARPPRRALSGQSPSSGVSTLGQAGRRRAGTRVSTSAERRDRIL
jgi:type IV secretion system protein VirB6